MAHYQGIIRNGIQQPFYTPIVYTIGQAQKKITEMESIAQCPPYDCAIVNIKAGAIVSFRDGDGLWKDFPDRPFITITIPAVFWNEYHQEPMHTGLNDLCGFSDHNTNQLPVNHIDSDMVIRITPARWNLFMEGSPTLSKKLQNIASFS